MSPMIGTIRWRGISAWILGACWTFSATVSAQLADGRLDWIRPGSAGVHFVRGGAGERFVVWGVNYDHDGQGRLLEDYWEDEWATVVEDFQEIKSLGANVVRIHLQVGRFLESASQPNEAGLGRLARLVRLAERTGLYLDLTGLGCYHKADVPGWYDALDEAGRWEAQAVFWKSVAGICRNSPAIFCYDLMNEPILPGKEPGTDWLAGDFAGKHFVQRISLELKGRSRDEVAKAWVEKLVGAIREIDSRHMITVGVIPWAHVWKNAKPIFHSMEVGASLDFVSVHFYPKAGDVAGSLEALRVYELGKPLVVEEIFPLKCSLSEVEEFITGSREFTDGWISFYWGATAEESQAKGDIPGAIVAQWLRWFASDAARAASGR